MAKCVHNKERDNRREEKKNRYIQEKLRFNLLHYNVCLLANEEKAFNGVWDGAQVPKLKNRNAADFHLPPA